MKGITISKHQYNNRRKRALPYVLRLFLILLLSLTATVQPSAAKDYIASEHATKKDEYYYKGNIYDKGTEGKWHIYEALDENGTPFENLLFDCPENSNLPPFNGYAYSTAFRFPENKNENVKIVVPGKKLEIAYNSELGVVLGALGNRNFASCQSIGTENSPMETISIIGSMPIWQHPGLLIGAGSNRKNSGIELYGDNITLAVTGAPQENRHYGVIANGQDNTQNTFVEVHAGKKLNITGDIYGGYMPEFIGHKNFILKTSDSQININTAETDAGADVKLTGNIYTAQYTEEYRGNSIHAKFRTPGSCFTGFSKDLIWKSQRDPTKNEGIYLTFTNNALWEMTGNSYVTSLELSNGACVNISHGLPENKRTLFVFDSMTGTGANPGKLKMRIDSTSADKTVTSDKLAISGTHHGDHIIELIPSGDYKLMEGTPLVWVKDEQGRFFASESESSLYWEQYTLDKRPIENKLYTLQWYLKKVEKTAPLPKLKLTTPILTTLAAEATNYHLTRTMNDSLHFRLGELRRGAGAGGWFKGGKNRFSRDDGYNFETDYSAFEAGLDRMHLLKNGTQRFYGFSLLHIDGDTTYSGQENAGKVFGVGRGDNKGNVAALYMTDIDKTGYNDFVLRAGRLKHDFSVYDSHGRKIEAKTENSLFALSAERGWTFTGQKGYFIEPQVQLTYTLQNGDTISFNNGLTAEQDNCNSFIGRAGVRFGRFYKKGSVYAHVNVLHEFMGDFEIFTSYGSETRKDSLTFRDTWIEWGAGATWELAENASFYCDILKSDNSDFHENYKWTVGLRFAL